MAMPSNQPAARLLRHLAVAQCATELSDPQLLERFAVYRDEAAFSALVRRHGPLVLGVGRRVLGDLNAAEDVLQATFLVLARRARSLRQPERLGSWLYGVALRIARKAGAAAVRRRRHECRSAVAGSVDASTDLARQELLNLLDEAIARLPEKYRVPVVLCYLEGRTVSEASHELGWPRGTVATRLNRGREQLRQGLVRRGVTLSGAALAVALSVRQASAAVPMRLSLSTAQAAALVAAGKAAYAVVPARVAALAEGGLQAMTWTKSKMIVVTALTLGLVVLGVGSGMYRAGADEPKPNRGTPSEPQAVAAPTNRSSEPISTPPIVAAERTIQGELRILKRDPKGSLKAGTQELLSMPRIRTLENQQATVFVGQDIPSASRGDTIQPSQVGVRMVFVAKFGKERGTALLDLTCESIGLPQKIGARTEQQTLKKQIRDAVKLGETATYTLGRDVDDKPVWIELVVWEVKEVLVGQDAKPGRAANP